MMTEDKLKEVIEKLRLAVIVIPELEKRNHLLTMPDRMLLFLKEGRREKVMRWVGFMQGCLWMEGADLEALKKMLAPDGE